VCLWQADKVAQWLANNDFDDRKLLFRSNGIHGALLVGLTDADLQNFLDMSNSIERARLLRDIRHLCDEPIDVVPRSPGAPTAAAEQRKALVERAAAASASAAAASEVVTKKRSSDVMLNGNRRNADDDDADDADDSNDSSSNSSNSSNSNSDDEDSSEGSDDYSSSDGGSSSSSDMPTERLSSGSDKLPHIDLSKKTGVMNTDSPPKRYRAELVTVYNAPSLPKPPKNNPPPPTDAVGCRLCNKRNVDCTIGPCGHKTACMRCAELLDKCPTCKRSIDELSPF
jgi:hypothetical protein